MKKAAYLIAITVLLISMPAFAKNKDYVTATDIQKVNLNDTFEQVTATIGEPQQVLSKELMADGKEQVVWQYEAVEPFKKVLHPVSEEVREEKNAIALDQSPQSQILRGLLKMAESGTLTQEQVFGAINQLAETPVAIPGSSKGIIDAFKTGGGFGQPRTESLGIDKATTMVKEVLETSKLVSEEGRAEEEQPLASYQQLRMQNPPYLIIFTNGKVSKIERQKVEAVPTAQVNVQSY